MIAALALPGRAATEWLTTPDRSSLLTQQPEELRFEHFASPRPHPRLCPMWLLQRLRV